jgi:nucleoside-diphosphate-sugar epimerase
LPGAESQAANLQRRQRRGHRPEALAQTVRELAPQTDIKVIGSSGTASEKSVPLDLSTSKAELGYTPKFPLKEALRNYMEELWEEQRS